MIDLKQFEDLIIVPTLNRIGQYSLEAVELVLGTAIQESNLKYLKQLGSGPALGVFQMEPATHDDIWDNFLKFRESLANSVALLTVKVSPTSMIGNLWYATAMCRVHYSRVPDPLPEQGDYEGQAAYWKEHYNTYLGAGTEEEYLENWHKYMD